MQTLYLHIGTHKTATTWLQHFLGRNIDLLNDYGFYYPTTGRVTQAQHRLGQAIFQRSAPAAPLDNVPIWKKLKRELSLTKHENIVMSSEEFEWVMHPKLIREYLPELRIHTIIYLRRQDDYLESLYGQQIRDFHPRLTKTIDRYIADTNLGFLDYRRLIERWESASDDLTIRIFDKKFLKNGDIGADFLSVLGIDSSAGFEAPTAAVIDHKASLSLEALEFVRHCNFLKLNAVSHDRLVDQVIKLDKIINASDGKDSRRLLPFDQRKDLIEKYEKGNRYIAQRYPSTGILPTLFLPVEDRKPTFIQSDEFNRFEVALKASRLVNILQ
ncbi:hypothetical protein BDE18_4194 [Paracoccus pantotrophus]|uniref:Sulfotransferase family protein n=1 Tax=Paracoccus pantotrophus TaxID=82367 RepID=A0AAE6NVX9_PARPN|nr:hypothetical protein [Paracoccus pantotrophus]QFG36197.1 hypothetical protein ESD82_08115 [Paracoccus pantotrophus]RKS43230.1 hypothetical protein BDE18_4194 [Paracoccus pantotrophus]